jgi:hypothetical protein
VTTTRASTSVAAAAAAGGIIFDETQILARRLGLGGILNAPILVDGHHGRAPKKGIGLSSGIKKRSCIIDNIVDDEDLARVVNVSLLICRPTACRCL